MIQTIINNEIVNCVKDLWRWDYHHIDGTLERDFLPLTVPSICRHRVGIERIDRFYCCECGHVVLVDDDSYFKKEKIK